MGNQEPATSHSQLRPTALGVRGVALFEATKGIAVILAGAGVFSLIHRNLQTVAEHFVAQLHLNPARHMAQVFLAAAKDLNDSRLRMLALLALLYSAMRFIEAFGLWREQRWAEWFAVISGGVYLPLEIIELTRGFSWMKLTVLSINLAIVAYLVHVLAAQQKRNRP
jgi:uncharacterized membrane protein (DUF2068 family)